MAEHEHNYVVVVKRTAKKAEVKKCIICGKVYTKRTKDTHATHEFTGNYPK